MPDDLTGMYNRKAYENDLSIFPEVPEEKDFVYFEFDVNGLKIVNDNLGHAAGDELLTGAAECLELCFGS